MTTHMPPLEPTDGSVVIGCTAPGFPPCFGTCCTASATRGFPRTVAAHTISGWWPRWHPGEGCPPGPHEVLWAPPAGSRWHRQCLTPRSERGQRGVEWARGRHRPRASNPPCGLGAYHTLRPAHELSALGGHGNGCSPAPPSGGLWKLVARVATSEIFLHVLCIPALITSLSFIGFWHISNEFKEWEDSYEFAIESFLELGCLCGRKCSSPMLLQSVSTDLQQVGWCLKIHNS
jgi:hypothetical protein